MDGFIVTAAIFGIISLLALYMIFRAIKNFIREGKQEQEEQAPVAPRAVMTAMPKPAQAPAKPQTAPAPAAQPAVVAEPKEAEKAKEPEAHVETRAVEVTPAAEPVKGETEVVTAVEGEAGACAVEETEAKTEDGAAEAETAETAEAKESKYPPIKTQAPNGESEKRVAEIQDILGKHV
ncbi:MAG: hypothetical protein QME41_06295 [Actinomycetota bacterium]|nr:hypothetical protein [Actinomycetota bacterium]